MHNMLCNICRSGYVWLSAVFQSTTDDYEEMPIAEFGKAMLRGMGWKEGNAIGKSNQGLDSISCILYLGYHTGIHMYVCICVESLHS